MTMHPLEGSTDFMIICNGGPDREDWCVDQATTTIEHYHILPRGWTDFDIPVNEEFSDIGHICPECNEMHAIGWI